MTVAVKSLADGQLPVSIGDLYTCPASTQAIIKTITLVNTHSAAVDINLYFTPSGGTARRFIPKDMELGISYLLVWDTEITLEAGDKIQGDSTVADVVDFVIHGVTNT